MSHKLELPCAGGTTSRGGWPLWRRKELGIRKYTWEGAETGTGCYCSKRGGGEEEKGQCRGDPCYGKAPPANRRTIAGWSEFNFRAQQLATEAILCFKKMLQTMCDCEWFWGEIVSACMTDIEHVERKDCRANLKMVWMKTFGEFKCGPVSGSVLG